MILFVFQLVMNLLSGYFLYKVYKTNKDQKILSPPDWRAQWEEEKKVLTEQFSMQIRSMRLLCERTQKMLEEKEWDFRKNFPPSSEENELKHLLSQSQLGHCVSLDEFEREKNEFNAKHSLDLKKLLSEQLC